MTKTKSFGLAAVIAALGFSAACNSDYTPVEITYTSVAVTSFSTVSYTHLTLPTIGG